jgi:tRNA-specific adenosine deaminase 2
MSNQNPNNHVKWMKQTINVAKNALQVKEVPVGCVIVHNDEQVIGQGHNLTNLTKNPTRHAEFCAIDEVKLWCEQNKKDLNQILQESTLYVTCEPCIMCASALRIINLKNIVFGCKNDRFGGCGGVLDLCTNSPLLQNYGTDLKIVKGVCEDAAIKLLQSFYACENPFAPEPKCKTNRKKIDLTEIDN